MIFTSYWALNESRKLVCDKETSWYFPPSSNLETPKISKFDLHYTKSHNSVENDWNLTIQYWSGKKCGASDSRTTQFSAGLKHIFTHKPFKIIETQFTSQGSMNICSVNFSNLAVGSLWLFVTLEVFYGKDIPSKEHGMKYIYF